MLLTPKSKSPALVAAPPMAKTAIQAASAMTSLRRPSSDVTPLGFTQIPGAGVFVTASPDGSIWVLSTQGTGGDKFIYHYLNGTWSNIPGAATRLAAGPDNSLWAINSSGGIYRYLNGAWSTIAGGASDITVGADGAVYVISSVAGNQYGNGIWRYAGSAWTQMPGAGIRIAASFDLSTYASYNVAPNGFYVINAQLAMFSYNSGTGYTQIPGAANQFAPTMYGGVFALGVPTAASGDNPIYYNNLSTGTWTQQAGNGVSIATNSSTVYLIDAAGGIYYAPITSPTPLPWTATQHQNFVALAYGGNNPQHIAIFSPGQSTASSTITYNGCCIYAIAFDPQGNLVASTNDNGLVVWVPGNTGAPSRTLSDQKGFSLATNVLSDLAIGGYNAGSNVAVYLGGAADQKIIVPGAPAFQGLALSPTGEFAVAASDGSVLTYPRGSTTSNRTIPIDRRISPTSSNFAQLAYDGLGNLAVGGGSPKTVDVFAPGATTSAYSVTLSSSTSAVTFDRWNRLIAATGSAIYTYPAGSTTAVRTITVGGTQSLAVGPQGDVAVAGSTSHVYQSNGNVVTISGLTSPEGIAISP